MGNKDEHSQLTVTKVLPIMTLFFLVVIGGTMITEAYWRGKLDYFLLSNETRHELVNWQRGVFCEPIILVGHPKDVLLQVDEITRTGSGIIELHGRILVRTPKDTVYAGSDIGDVVSIDWTGLHGGTDVYKLRDMFPLVDPHPLRFSVIVGDIYGVATYTDPWVFDPKCFPRNRDNADSNT